jgi:DNA repair exonuclease SbcCD ATPase subunit
MCQAKSLKEQLAEIDGETKTQMSNQKTWQKEINKIGTTIKRIEKKIHEIDCALENDIDPRHFKKWYSAQNKKEKLEVELKSHIKHRIDLLVTLSAHT